MPDIRRCAIYGCKSNSRENKGLKFFNFPARENPLYEIWLSICHESNDSIRLQRRPYICSKHFHEKDVGFRRLAIGAVPALYLTAPPGFAEEENARLAEIEAVKEEKFRRVQLVNDAVLEWCRRAQHYPETAAVCITRRELRRVATRVRNLLGSTLTLNVDDYWLRKFRRSHMVQLATMDLDESRNKSLDLPTIIYELDPDATLLSEEEIAVLVKEEQVKLVQMELNKSSAKSSQMYDTDNSAETDSKYSDNKLGTKMNKRSFEDGLPDYYGSAKDESRSSDNKSSAKSSQMYDTYNSPEIDSKYSEKKMGSKRIKRTFDYYGPTKDDTQFDTQFEIKFERNDSIDLTDDGFDDCDNYEGNKDKYSGQAGDLEPLIVSYKQALEHLKPLEDFALRQENYRAIGLLSTLEIMFKNPRPPQRANYVPQ